MARTYSTHLCAIWNDPAFRSLSSLARDTYWMLSTQPEIDAAGCMALTLRRWSENVPEVAEGLRELAVAGFVVVDADTEEVLVAPFAESDGGYKHSKRVHAVISAANAIRSESLRKAAWKELGRLGVANNVPPDRQSNATPEPTDSPTDVVTTYVTQEHPSSHNPQEGAPPSDEPSPYCSNHQPAGTDEPCGPCGTAKMRNARWHREQTQHHAATKAQAAKQRRDCPHCDENGLRLNDDGRPLGRCDHQAREATA